MNDDVWKSPESEAAPAVPAVSSTPAFGGSDDPTDVPKAIMEDMKAHVGPYLMANFGYMGFVMAFVTAIVALVLLCMLPGFLMDDETVILIGAVAGFCVYTLLLLGFAFVGAPLMTASMLRGLDAQRRGEGTIGLLSSVNALRPKAGAVIGVYALTQLLVFAGILVLYIPGLIAAAIGSFAMPIVVFEDVGAIDALKLAWKHAKSHGSWHVGVWMLLFMAIIVLEISIVGLFFLFPVLCAWQLYAYRLAYGDAGALGADNDAFLAS